ncbi:MAG: hypothetical protein KDD55_03110 [Bdellovibrionales bacterium]|nr:hypothetical protein [Bdellovibrionales bacterium]
MNHYLALWIAIFFTSIGQTILKSGVNQGESWAQSTFHPRTIFGYGIYVASTLLGLYSLQVVPFKVFLASASASYVLVILFAFLFLKERIDRLQLVGIACITAGILLFAQ